MQHTSIDKKNSVNITAYKTGKMSVFFDSLSNSYYRYDRKSIKKHWLNILENKDSAINFLYTFRGNNLGSDWRWFDLKSNVLISHKKVKTSKEIAALYYINAIYYKDLSFATNKVIYNDSLLSKFKNVESENRDEFESSVKSIETNILWDSVYNWKEKNYMGRPFGNLSNIYWIGEASGKISRQVAGSFLW